MTSAAINDYRNQLMELKTNHLPQINLLTMLAEDMKKVAHLIVTAIEMHLKTCSESQKLPVLYVVDSILKNVQWNEYRVLFAANIVSMFEQVFLGADKKTRQSLYHLRQTWGASGRFLPSKLYALDLKVNKIDTAWPISHPKVFIDQKTTVTHEKCGAQKRKSPPSFGPTEHIPKIQKLAPNLKEISSILAKISPPKVAPPTLKTEIKQEEIKQDVFALLRNLQKSGILKPSLSQNGTQKEEPPTPALLAQDFANLRIRKSSVVASLLTRRSDSCKFCGLKLDNSNGKSKFYQDHMDHHVRVNLGIEKSKNIHRQWYPSASTWLTAKPEITVPEKVLKVEINNLGVESTGHKIKDCSVCGEQFQEYFNDEDETWRFKDTVMANGMIVHSECASDAQNSPNENINILEKVKKERNSDYNFGFF